MAGTTSSLSPFLILFMFSCCYASAARMRSDVSIVSGLSWTFYDLTCPLAESIILAELKIIFEENIERAAGLLRLHFHDCFVQGCEGSILLVGNSSDPSEQEAPPNLSLQAEAFVIINDLRALLEEACGRVVSCADIVALAARDSVYLTGGPYYEIPLGRRDGLTFATRAVVLANLPSPTSNTTTLLTSVASKNLTATDLVALSGAHSIGRGNCSSFITRLYPTQDSTLNETFADDLKLTCPSNETVNTTVLDIRTPYKFDNKYYVNLVNGEGLFTSDQDLYVDNRTSDIVKSFALNEGLFFEKFVDFMVTMGQFSVLTGTEGEIRANCSVINSDDTYWRSIVEEAELIVDASL